VSFSFTYAALLTATAVHPATAGVADRSVLTLTGSGFASNPNSTVVWVGALPCVVLTAAPTNLTCQLDGGAPAVKPGEIDG
jgi:hypothetical protein